jgi:hypothetical protein
VLDNYNVRSYIFHVWSEGEEKICYRQMKLLSSLKKRIYGGIGNGGGNVGIVTSNKKYLTMCLLMYYDWKPLECIVFVIAGMRNIERTLCRKWLKE